MWIGADPIINDHCRFFGKDGRTTTMRTTLNRAIIQRQALRCDRLRTRMVLQAGRNRRKCAEAPEASSAVCPVNRCERDKREGFQSSATI